jgi:hypothetical protein
MATKAGRSTGKRTLELDPKVYDGRAVENAVEEWGAGSRVLKTGRSATITVEVAGTMGDADEFMNLALLRTIEERRR